jgi:uncharacterized surface protein with fasciclin (FAS1) repeats
MISIYNTTKKGRIAVLSLALAFFVGCGEQQAHWKAGIPSIYDTIKANPELEALTQAVEDTKLNRTLDRPGSYTLFAPTNDAFRKLGREKLDFLTQPANIPILANILAYHLTKNQIDLRSLMNTSQLKTFNGRMLEIQSVNGELKINNASLITSNIATSNGIIHIIDTVLVPED